MSAFCAEQGISRKTFYAIRARARSEGPAAALEPRSTRPASSPTRIGQEMVLRALAVRSALESSGLDHGPISVHDKMRSMGLEAPSPASLARIFRRKGVARSEPRKRPRSAWRRFVYPAPNACWQLDATEYVLAGGRKAVIFQLQDDHSRLAVASLVAPGETSDAAIAVFDKGVAAHGVPQRLLTDNGAALNPSRRGHAGRLVEHVRALGVEPITGRPYKPTTQGKNERFHQTLLRYLDKQPPAESIADWIAPGLMEAVMTGRITAMGQRKYSLELRERATRMALEARADPDRSRGAVRRIAEELGIHPEALRTWVRQAEIDRGDRPGTTTDEARRIKELEKEVRELRRAGEVLRRARACFARAGCEHRWRRLVHR